MSETGHVEAARVGGRAQVPCTRFTLIVGMPQAGALNFLARRTYIPVSLIFAAIAVRLFLSFLGLFNLFTKKKPAKPSLHALPRACSERDWTRRGRARGGRAQVPCTRFTLIVGMPQAGALNFQQGLNLYPSVADFRRDCGQTFKFFRSF